ncbi:zinc-ribbon domain-containing protein [Marivivens sp. JLT3646]|jgi:predicted Zn finger-like uncharacterized protein|uniref:zinc-ribbon domain-containing protein n=1 Tax=Marivivens sp. JLT3646 TaxID=1920883 RepID=UPI0007FCC8ED|nr:zinc-ribbon domain-containing protein [Marivivens sp. JLT3646]APO85918.1 hypothetical protein BSK21_02000 [Marivivens sp. JLT3646]OBR36992.1 hypothetical protein A9199_06545 [Donghicola sp. JL3646]
MRLICPNCGAQYEVPDDVIPEAGRDVQCSNCGSTWFERPGDSDREENDAVFTTDIPVAQADSAPEDVQEDDDLVMPEPDFGPEPAPVFGSSDDYDEDYEDDLPPPTLSPRRPRRTIDPEIASILQEEADRAEERRRESQQDPMESQPDLGLDEPPSPEAKRAEEARRRMSLLKGETELNDAGPRSDRLPDIDEINSTLRSASERPDNAVAQTAQVVRRKSGFKTGFLGVLLIAVVSAGGYVFADRIAAIVPQTQPALETYVTWVDGQRIALDETVQGMLANLGND